MPQDLKDAAPQAPRESHGDRVVFVVVVALICAAALAFGCYVGYSAGMSIGGTFFTSHGGR